MKCIAFVFCILCLLPPLRARTTEVTAVVDMSPEGRKLVHPDPDHPAYYVPVMFGFTEPGGSVAHGEKPPPENDVAKLVAEALGRQGYLLAHPGLLFNRRHEVIYADQTVLTVPAYPRPDRPFLLDQGRDYPLTVDMLESAHGPYSFHIPHQSAHQPLPPLVQVLRHVDPVHGPVLQGLPSLVITIRWGDVHPGEVSVGADQPPLNMNLGTMVALIAGNTFENLSRWDQDEIMQRTSVDRYFVVISAYDFPILLRERKSVLLWSTKMTVPSNFDAELGKMLPLLMKAGEAHLGRETTRPQLTTVDLSQGRVIIGVPRVKEDGGSNPPSVGAPPSSK